MADERPTREQERAQAAFQLISEVEKQKWKQEYGRQCLHLPALIHQCGLCQTLAFLEAKGADEKKPWFRVLLNHLGSLTKIASDWRGLTNEVRNAPLLRYQWMTRETLACAQWLKRYAEAVLKVQLGEEEERGA